MTASRIPSSLLIFICLPVILWGTQIDVTRSSVDLEFDTTPGYSYRLLNSSDLHTWNSLGRFAADQDSESIVLAPLNQGAREFFQLELAAVSADPGRFLQGSFQNLGSYAIADYLLRPTVLGAERKLCWIDQSHNLVSLDHTGSITQTPLTGDTSRLLEDVEDDRYYYYSLDQGELKQSHLTFERDDELYIVDSTGFVKTVQNTVFDSLTLERNWRINRWGWDRGIAFEEGVLIEMRPDGFSTLPGAYGCLVIDYDGNITGAVEIPKLLDDGSVLDLYIDKDAALHNSKLYIAASLHTRVGSHTDTESSAVVVIVDLPAGTWKIQTVLDSVDDPEYGAGVMKTQDGLLYFGSQTSRNSTEGNGDDDFGFFSFLDWDGVPQWISYLDYEGMRLGWNFKVIFESDSEIVFGDFGENIPTTIYRMFAANDLRREEYHIDTSEAYYGGIGVGDGNLYFFTSDDDILQVHTVSHQE